MDLTEIYYYVLNYFYLVKKQPLVTIITPSLNQGCYIEETILSVINQDYPFIEHIIIDGGSTDGTINILEKYNNHISWFSEKDNGQTEAINKGLHCANGDILAYLNSDDTYLPDTITRIVHYLTVENPSAKFVYGNGYIISADGSLIEKFPTEPYNSQRLTKTCYILQPTTFWKRDIINDIGVFDERFDLAMDYDYWIRISNYYGILWYLPEYLANSRVHSNTKSMRRTLEHFEEVFKVLEKNYGCGNVDFLWIKAYAYKYLLHLKCRKIFSYKIFLILGVIIIVTIKNIQYNKKIPLLECQQIIKNAE